MESVTKIEPQGWITATITRADGTVEELGVIASTEDGTMTASQKPTLKERIGRPLKKEKSNG